MGLIFLRGVCAGTYLLEMGGRGFFIPGVCVCARTSSLEMACRDFYSWVCVLGLLFIGDVGREFCSWRDGSRTCW